MEFNENEYMEYMSLEYLIMYGYFDFRKSTREYQYSDVVSKTWSKELWSLEMLYHELDAGDLDIIVGETLKNKKDKDKIEFKKKEIISECIVLNMRKDEYTKRKFKYQNLFNYSILCYLLSNYQEEFKKYYIGDTCSIKKNQITTYSENERKQIKKMNLKNKNQILQMDIANFFHSIYTHTIPWMFMGKKEAKAQRFKGLYNTLDKAIQYSQDGETKGLPVGSITSSIIAETYQLQLDKKYIQDKFSSYIRYCDDYTFYIDDKSTADSIVHLLSNTYAKYELYINNSKTKHYNSPKSKDLYYLQKFSLKDIISDLQSGSLNNTDAKKKIRFLFDWHNEFSRDNSNNVVFYFELQNFFRKLKKIDVKLFDDISTDEYIVHYIFDLILIERKYIHEMRNLIELLEYEEKICVRQIMHKYENEVNKQILKYIENEYTMELVQMLTICILLNLKVDKKTLLELIENSNSFAAIISTNLYLLHYNKGNYLLKLMQITRDRLENKHKEVKVENKYSYCYSGDNYLYEHEIRVLMNMDEISNNALKLYKNKLNHDKDIKCFYDKFNAINPINRFYINLQNKSIGIYKWKEN